MKKNKYNPRTHKVNIKNIGQDVIDLFHKLYYDTAKQTYGNTFYFGVPTLKCPLDLWVYQEIIYRTKPDVIIETGTYKGGSALFLAHILDAMGNGKVITIDNHSEGARPDRKMLQHKRIIGIVGDSISPTTVRQVKKLIVPTDRVMVILDSNHLRNHVLKELNIYTKLVTRGNYLILEDTNINGHPVYPEFGPGPMEALDEFLITHKNFVSDRRMEKFYVTFNPCGYLRCTK